jgi:hypothetical protein
VTLGHKKWARRTNIYDVNTETTHLSEPLIVTSKRRSLTKDVRCPKDGRNCEANSESEGAPCDEVLRKRSSNPEEALNEKVDEEGRSAAYAASTRKKQTDYVRHMTSQRFTKARTEESQSQWPRLLRDELSSLS